MRKIRCYECGKSYDFDIDDFCPKCGAFSQPGKSLCIGADGTVVRTDGLNEKNHAGSFVHQEFHMENQIRKAVGLSKSVKRPAQAVSRPSQPARAVPVTRQSQEKKGKNSFDIIKWVILAIIGMNVLSSIIGSFFW